jgi:predicted dehydrogenase
MAKQWKIAGINFAHMHMGDLLRRAHVHPQAEIVGICDENPARMETAVRSFELPPDRVFTDYRACLEKTQPDLVILCPATAEHGLWTRRISEFGVHILVEKPFASSLAEADEMIRAQRESGKLLAINWPTRWSPVCITAKRLIDEGAIGSVLNVYHYGGNRGPLFHRADKVEANPTPEEKAASWFYQRARGGGSLMDYAGYGATLGTWFQNGRKPLEITCVTDGAPGLEVDEHSITVCRYEHGLSRIETRWGTFTDPWTLQPQPQCGYVICGTRGTLAAYDYAPEVRLQTSEHPEGRTVPVDEVRAPYEDPIQYMLHVMEGGEFERGPLHPEIARIGQQIIDSAALSAREKRTVALVE